MLFFEFQSIFEEKFKINAHLARLRTQIGLIRLV
jgi:hypothetical protein